MKTVKQVVLEVTNNLNSAGVAEAAANAEFIICTLLNKSRTEILAFGESVFPEDKQELLHKIIKEKIAGLPLEYIFSPRKHFQSSAQQYGGHPKHAHRVNPFWLRNRRFSMKSEHLPHLQYF